MSRSDDKVSSARFATAAKDAIQKRREDRRRHEDVDARPFYGSPPKLSGFAGKEWEGVIKESVRAIREERKKGVRSSSEQDTAEVFYQDSDIKDDVFVDGNKKSTEVDVFGKDSQSRNLREGLRKGGFVIGGDSSSDEDEASKGAFKDSLDRLPDYVGKVSLGQDFGQNDETARVPSPDTSTRESSSSCAAAFMPELQPEYNKDDNSRYY